MDADGNNKTAVAAFRHNDFAPCWSPDGELIAFQTMVDSSEGVRNHEICVIAPDGSGLARVTDHPGWDTHPDWFRDSAGGF